MFRRILVPTDLTDRTVKALDIASGMGMPDDRRVTLLHVIETVAGIDFEELSSFYGALEKRAWARLNEMAAGASVTRGAVDVEIVYGRRAEETLRFVRANQIDLIVLASHPIDPSQPYSGLGTMSYKLAILAPCAVLLVK